jgi:integrase-like protein
MASSRQPARRSPGEEGHSADSHDLIRFQRRLAGMSIAEVVSAPGSPWQNPYVERLIGSIRRECLDHVIVINEAHLRRVLTTYSRYYHRSRTHLGLKKDTPDHRPVSGTSTGPIVAIPEVGGLHHRYERRALAADARRPIADARGGCLGAGSPTARRGCASACASARILRSIPARQPRGGRRPCECRCPRRASKRHAAGLPFVEQQYEVSQAGSVIKAAHNHQKIAVVHKATSNRACRMPPGMPA